MTVLLVLAFFVFFIGLDYLVTRGGSPARRELTRSCRLPPRARLGGGLPDAGDALLSSRPHLGTAARLRHGARRHRRLRPQADRRPGSAPAPLARRLAAPGRPRLRSPKLDGKGAELVSPVEGEVVEVNREVAQKPALATEDPYGRGWVLKVKAPNLATNLRNLLSGRLAASGWRTAARRSSCG